MIATVQENIKKPKMPDTEKKASEINAAMQPTQTGFSILSKQES